MKFDRFTLKLILIPKFSYLLFPQTSYRHDIYSVFTTIGEPACGGENHQERWGLHLYCVNLA